jgi:hypothetical protein
VIKRLSEAASSGGSASSANRKALFRREHVGSAIDGNGQAIVEIDWVNVTTACWQNSSNLHRE